MKLVLNSTEIMRRSRQENAHRLALVAQVSAPTVNRLINNPNAVQSFDAEALGNILTKGLGLTVEEAGELKLSDVFLFVDGA